MRYAIDATRILDGLGWRPRHSFEEALAETVDWYLANQGWAEKEMAKAGGGARLGLAANAAGR
jgi:dTDP-glucose 4,6-dehydratase